jgi:4a-hydroxytetrahydrobiopterin dehydratase
MSELTEKKCVPCEEGTEPLNTKQIEEYTGKLETEWEVLENKKIYKEFPFENFMRGMEFANKVAAIAEEENHHPDMCVHYPKVDITLSTHNIGGLSENDFILAAKIEKLLK